MTQHLYLPTKNEAERQARRIVCDAARVRVVYMNPEAAKLSTPEQVLNKINAVEQPQKD